MKNRKILITFIMLSLLGIIYSFAGADFDCSTFNKADYKIAIEKQKSGITLTNDETALIQNGKSCIGTIYSDVIPPPKMTDEIKAILEKKKAGTELTTDEQAKLDTFNADVKKAFESNKPSSNLVSPPKMTDEIKAILEKKKAGTELTTDEQAKLDTFNVDVKKTFESNKPSSNLVSPPKMTDEIKAILEKKKAGTELTTDEQAKLDTFNVDVKKTFESNNKLKVLSGSLSNKNSSSLSVSNKNLLDKKISGIISSLSSYSDTDKITKLQAIVEKLQGAISTINSSTTYTLSKKELYVNMINYLIKQFNSEIESIQNSGDSTDLIDNLLGQ
ncbi:MAG: hypothetical protein PHE25_02045 [Candidatus Gracilibacteria bacterium]|nr:hypothetical protein [Candidatus Gracilibacteria bacterium]